MRAVEGEEFFACLDNRFVVADFWARWCQPCRILSPIVERLAEEFENVAFVKVNAGSKGNRELAERYKVKSLPTLLFFQNGLLRSRLVSLLSPAEVMEWILKNIESESGSESKIKRKSESTKKAGKREKGENERKGRRGKKKGRKVMRERKSRGEEEREIS